MKWARALLCGLAVAMLACIGATLYAGHLLTRPAQVATGSPPAELNAATVDFPSTDGQALSAWFISGRKGNGAVLLLHSVRANKRAMSARARFLEREGFAVLILDLRAHGESGGDAITFGAREALDVDAAARKLQTLAPGERLGVIGVSLGAAAFLLSDAHERFSAVILESLYPTIEEAIANRLAIRLGSTARALTPLLVAQLKWRLSVEPAQLRPIERAALLKSPALMIHGTNDRQTSLPEARRIYDRITSVKSLYAVEGAAHVDLHRFAAVEYEKRVVEFLRHNLYALQ
jgi:fermentation-respiration switch protein FrsA (DUF1100 family)